MVEPGQSPYFPLETGMVAETNAVMVIAERWPATGARLQAELDASFNLEDKSAAKPKVTDVFSVKNHLEDRFTGGTLYGTFELLPKGDERCR